VHWSHMFIGVLFRPTCTEYGKGAITTTIKHAIKHTIKLKTSNVRLGTTVAALISILFQVLLQVLVAGCNLFYVLSLSFIVCFIVVVIAPFDIP